jgi:hypothetical protein
VDGGGKKEPQASSLRPQGKQKEDRRPLIHYVFSPENTYETTFRGGKALAVRDLGKGESADLVIPEQFTPYQRVYLGWDPDWATRNSDWMDVIVNVLGFIPFGLLMMLSLCRKGLPDKNGDGISKKRLAYIVLLTVVAGFVVSLAIEYLQAYLPSRDSSLRDLVTNTMGTMIGAVSAAWVIRKRNKLVTGDRGPVMP